MASADSVRDSGISMFGGRRGNSPHRRRHYPADTGSDGPRDRPRTVAEILSDVGDDPEKARAALDAEQDSANPRSTLITALTTTSRLSTPDAGRDPEGASQTTADYSTGD